MILIGKKLQKWIDDLRLFYLIFKIKKIIDKSKFENLIAENTSFVNYHEIGLLEMPSNLHLDFETFKKIYLVNNKAIKDDRFILLLFKIIKIQKKYIKTTEEKINPFNYEMY